MSDPARPHFSLARTRAAARARWAAFRAMAKERADRTGLAASLRRPRIQLVLMLVLLPWLAVWASPLFLFLAIPAVAAIPVAVLGWDRCVALLARHYATIVIGLAIFVSSGALAIGLWRVPFIVNGLLDELQAKADHPEATRGVVVALAAVLASITIIGTLIAQAIRVWTSERQTRTIEQGHVTDRLTKAIEQLGAEKTSKRILRDADGREVLKENAPVIVETTVPNLEVRLGAIYALERIAKDSDRDHQTIMEILCAYIRENAKAAEAAPNPLGECPETGAQEAQERSRLLAERRQALTTWIAGLPAPRIDVQAAATVIGRRLKSRTSAEKRASFRLDLRGANLRRADLKGAQLEGANLRGARLEGANLRGARLERASLIGAWLERAILSEARMEGAILIGARMDGAHLSEARMEGAHLSEARMEGAHLREARMERANLREAQMEGAYLRGARMEGANLREARMEGADLREARMEGANLREARMEGADLREARMEGADLREARMEGADLREARMEGADLREARMEGAILIGADFRNANWAGASNQASPAQFADFRACQELTQAQLEHFIGNAETLLPDRLENSQAYYVWSCWETPPADIDAIVATAAGPFADDADRAALRRQFLCGPDNPRVKTGTPWPLDAPRPEGHPLGP